MPLTMDLNAEHLAEYRKMDFSSQFESEGGHFQTQPLKLITSDEEDALLLHLPHETYLELHRAYCRDPIAMLRLLRTKLPSLEHHSLAQCQKSLSLFQEQCFKRKQLILRQDETPSYCYLICEGEVELQTRVNPVTKLTHQSQNGVDVNHSVKINDTAAGLGNLSQTLNMSRITTLTQGNWLGEELCLAKMPLLYDAVVISECSRVLRISIKNLGALTKDDKNRNAIAHEMWEKLEFVRDRMRQLHSAKESLMKDGLSTRALAEQVQHITAILPNSTFNMKKQTRRQLIYTLGHQAEFIPFQDNFRMEQIRKQIN